MKNPGRPALAPDLPAPTGSGQYNGLSYLVFIHEKIIDDITRAPELRRRLSLTLQHLASRGQTSVVKGCGPPTGAGDAAPWAAPAAWDSTYGGPSAADG